MIMNKIYVGNLSFKATEQEMDELFRQFGDISEVAIIRDRRTGQSKGFGFVTFASQEAAQNAVSMDGKEFLGRTMKVNIAREPEKRSFGDDDRRGGDRRGGGRRY